ncbi:hypothetical protein PVAR5_0417 [Paecilomyces variotii No. 5]|uniref:Uncharacterized protein n=1 Tax=Byssochlamys spectabilis (strain No. 5 / NBRC 109023) TaxID=1356009 RepID=V5FQE6_BYSSN|nr:hypothetical protein PVAR5_0417 [Paecilomyces variotii No. 5]
MLDMPSFAGYTIPQQSEETTDDLPVYDASPSTSHSRQEPTDSLEAVESDNTDMEQSSEPERTTERPSDVEPINTASDEDIDPLTPSGVSRPTSDEDELHPDMRTPDLDVLEPPPSYELAVGVQDVSADRPKRRSIIDIFIRRGSTVKTTPPAVTPIWRSPPAPAPILAEPVTEQDPDRFTYIIGGREYDDNDIYCL